MKGKHYYIFETEIQNKMIGNSLCRENWEILRNDSKPGPFSIEKDALSYENNNTNNSSTKEIAK